MKQSSTLVAALLFAALFASSALARAIGGVTLPESLRAGLVELKLNGAGVRKKLFLNIYAIGLYAKNKQQDAQSLINADEPMALRLHIVSSLITPEQMASNVDEGFSRSTNGNTAPIKERRDKMIAVFKNGIKKGDIYDLVYLPQSGTAIAKNGELKQTLPGLDFKKALFGIWLGRKPISEDLKKQLLGK